MNLEKHEEGLCKESKKWMMEDTVKDFVRDDTLVGNLQPKDPFTTGLYEIIDKWIISWDFTWRQLVMTKVKNSRDAHVMKCFIAHSLHCCLHFSKATIREVLVCSQKQMVEWTFNDFYRFSWNKVDATENNEDWWMDRYYDLIHGIEKYCSDQVLPMKTKPSGAGQPG